MALSSNIYEQKLYHMFQSHGNGDGSNSLDREALVKLCRTLELKERGHLLVKCLLTDAKTRVSFREFREGLLHILGGNEDSLGGENLQKSTSISINTTEGYGEPYNGKISNFLLTTFLHVAGYIRQAKR